MRVFPVSFGGIKINNAVIRGKDAFKKYEYRQIDKVDIGAIVAGKEEFIDLDVEDRNSNLTGSDLRMKRSKRNWNVTNLPITP